jgi:hypothetical protein
MSDTRRYVNAQQVMRFIDRAEPDMSDIQKSIKVQRSPKRWYNYRRQERMDYDTAERILDIFDLGYLLHTGDIEIYESEIKESMTDLLATSRESLRKTKQDYRYWRRRAEAAEAQLKQNGLEPSYPSLSSRSKEFVKPVDEIIVTW